MSRRRRFRLARATGNGRLASLWFARTSRPVKLTGDRTPRPIAR